MRNGMERMRPSRAILAAAFIAAITAQPALALSSQEVSVINSRVLDAVNNCTFNPTGVAEQIKAIASGASSNKAEAANVASVILNATQSLTNSPTCLFSVGEGLTRWAITFGETNSTAIAIATAIGQLGKSPVVNACVNTAGVTTKIGLACDPPTSDVFHGGQRTEGPSFNNGENPNQDDTPPGSPEPPDTDDSSPN